MGEFISLDFDMIPEPSIPLEDYFTEDAIELLKLSEFACIVRVEPERLLVSDPDLCGQYIPYSGTKIPAEEIGCLIKNPDFVIPEVFREYVDSEVFKKYGFRYLPDALYYSGDSIIDACTELIELTGVKVGYYRYDKAYVIVDDFDTFE